MAGSILTYMVMDYLNTKTTGNHMNNNPPGTEDKLLIPLGDGKTIGVPYMSSIAFLPRLGYKVGKNVVSGNLPQAGREMRGLLSTPIKPLADLASNENYYGQQIYDPELDSTSEKYKKMGLYAFSSLQHPYIKAAIESKTMNDPLYATISKAGEMPLRFYDFNKLEANRFYDASNQAKLTEDLTNKTVKAKAQEINKYLLSIKDPKQRSDTFNSLAKSGVINQKMIKAMASEQTRLMKKADTDFVKSVRYSSSSNVGRAKFIKELLAKQTAKRKQELFNELLTSELMTKDLLAEMSK